MTLLSSIHHASSDAGTESSPYSYSLFKFSTLNKDSITESEGKVKWLIGPVDLGITGAADKTSSLSALSKDARNQFGS